MELTDAQYARLSPLLPVQRGNVKIDNRRLLNALLYIAESGCKWRRLPKEYGNWHTVYVRLRRWADKGVLERIFAVLREQRLIDVRAHASWPDGIGARSGGPLGKRTAHDMAGPDEGTVPFYR